MLRALLAILALCLPLATHAGIPTPSPVLQIDARNFGAKCDGTTHDDVAINAGLTYLGAAGGGVLTLPAATCAVSATLSIPAHVKLVGAGHDSSILATTATNLNVISLAGSYSGFESLAVNCGAAGSNSSGNCVSVGAGLREILIRDFLLTGPFVGLATTTSVLVTVEDGYIYNPTATTGGCILVNGGNNQVISNVFCQGVQVSQPRDGIELQATGGIWMSNFQTLYAGTGELIDPGTGQVVTWVFENQDAYDTGSQNGIALTPSGTGSIRGYFCNQCWSSTNSLSGVAIVAGGSTVIDDVHFVAHRAYNNQQIGISIGNSVLNAYVEDSSVCGNSAAGSGTYDGITVGTATHVTITGNRVGNCAQFTTNVQRYGINLASGSNELTITHNDLTGNQTAPLSVGFTNSTLATIADNTGVNDQVASVASASSVTLPPNPIISITGTTPISNLLGGWQGRQVTLIPGTGTPNFYASGGTSGSQIAVTTSTTTSVPNTISLAGPAWYVK